MKTLILMRHAKAKKFSSINNIDLFRDLEEKGIQDAKIIAKKIIDLNEIPDLILCSHSNRTKQTLDQIVNELDKNVEIKIEESIYENEENRIIRLISNIDKKYDKIMLIGHNPSIEELSNLFSENFAEERFKPACTSIIEFSFKNWSEIKNSTGIMKHFISP